MHDFKGEINRLGFVDKKFSSEKLITCKKAHGMHKNNQGKANYFTR